MTVGHQMQLQQVFLQGQMARKQHLQRSDNPYSIVYYNWSMCWYLGWRQG
jgi:hypothetical protein